MQVDWWNKSKGQLGYHLSRIQVFGRYFVGYRNGIPSNIFEQDHPTSVPAFRSEHLETSPVSSVGMRQDSGASRSMKKLEQPYLMRFRILLFTIKS